MQRVLTVSLNLNAYQIEADAYAQLEAYLAAATRKLDDNPDRAEILRDLEQAIADRCKQGMRKDQSVISLAELEPALAAIGEVDGATQGASSTQAQGSKADHDALQQVSENAYISGVCAGLARSAKIDVTLVRVIAVVLLFISNGAMIALYLALMLLIPYAPLNPDAAPLRTLPRRCRELVTALRAKLKALTG